MKYLEVFFIILIASQGFAAGQLAPQSKEEYCRHIHDSEYFINMAFDRENSLAHKNEGGLLYGGVCWWHSLFQRSSLYLSVFRPALPKPTRQQARAIIYNLRHRQAVVEVPGYADLFDFSQAWWPEIQKSLTEWEVSDGFLKQKWIDNMRHTTHLDPAQLHKRMNDLWDEVENKKRITWVMLKYPGIQAHAWLVLRILPVRDGYQLEVLDSNLPGRVTFAKYVNGSSALKSRLGETVPYIFRTDDFSRFEKAQNSYCSQ